MKKKININKKQQQIRSKTKENAMNNFCTAENEE